MSMPTVADDLDSTLPQSGDEGRRTAQLSQGDGVRPGTAPGFELLRPIGQGAYGSVWLAKEQKTGRFAAIKFYTRRGQDWLLLGREVEKLAALDSSHHIVGLIDVGWENDPPYYAMEYLPNGSLEAYLSAGPLAAAQAVELGRGILSGLVHAHGAGILHCDLKPANVLLDQDMRPRLCDFGQSRLSAENRPALGTLFYMAPEQADLSAMPDVRWDVYAFGAILYHMLAGRPPHRSLESEAALGSAGETTARLAVYQRIIRRDGPPQDLTAHSGVDKQLAAIVERCLEPLPTKRFPNAQAVVDALDARDRERGRRPLIALGLIGPLLLLAAMTPFFVTTMRNAVKTAKANLVARALESDALSARLFAEDLRRVLHERKIELEEIAEDPKLRRLVEQTAAGGWADRSAIEDHLRSRQRASDDRRARLGLRPDTSWFLQDADGFFRWRGPFGENTIDRDFSWRNYFHGQDKEYSAAAAAERIEPIRKTHVSTIYRSQETKQYMVAISTPVRSVDGTTVVGVLARTQHLWELLADYENQAGERLSDGRDSVDRKRLLALVDSRDWRLVAHPWMTEGHLGRLTNADAATLAIPRQKRETLRRALSAPAVVSGGAAATVSDYEDPVSASGFGPREYGGEWLAALRPIPGTSENGGGWLAVVQERKEAVLAPAERMKSELLAYAAAALAVGGGLIVTFWYFVTQAIADRTGGRPRRDALPSVDAEARTP